MRRPCFWHTLGSRKWVPSLAWLPFLFIPVMLALQGGCLHHSLMGPRFSLTTELAGNARPDTPSTSHILFSMLAMDHFQGLFCPWFCVIPGAVQFCGLPSATRRVVVSPPRVTTAPSKSYTLLTGKQGISVSIKLDCSIRVHATSRTSTVQADNYYYLHTQHLRQGIALAMLLHTGPWPAVDGTTHLQASQCGSPGRTCHTRHDGRVSHTVAFGKQSSGL